MQCMAPVSTKNSASKGLPFFCRLPTRAVTYVNPMKASALHLTDHRRREFAALHFLRAFHEAGEIVGHHLAADGAVHALDDPVGGLGPAEVAEHHLARQDDAAG